MEEASQRGSGSETLHPAGGAGQPGLNAVTGSAETLEVPPPPLPGVPPSRATRASSCPL